MYWQVDSLGSVGRTWTDCRRQVRRPYPCCSGPHTESGRSCRRRARGEATRQGSQHRTTKSAKGSLQDFRNPISKSTGEISWDVIAPYLRLTALAATAGNPASGKLDWLAKSSCACPVQEARGCGRGTAAAHARICRVYEGRVGRCDEMFLCAALIAYTLPSAVARGLQAYGPVQATGDLGMLASPAGILRGSLDDRAVLHMPYHDAASQLQKWSARDQTCVSVSFAASLSGSMPSTLPLVRMLIYAFLSCRSWTPGQVTPGHSSRSLHDVRATAGRRR